MNILKHILLACVASLLVSCDSGETEESTTGSDGQQVLETHKLDNENRVRIILTSSEPIVTDRILNELEKVTEKRGEKHVLASKESSHVCELSFEAGNTDLKWVKTLELKHISEVVGVYEVVRHSDEMVRSITKPNGDLDVSQLSMEHKAVPNKGEYSRVKYTIIKLKPIVDGRDVENAYVSLTDPSVIDILLTQEGGDKMLDATDSMEHGVDRLAVVCRGEVLNVATLNDKLGSRFMISGLDSKEEAEILVRELKNPFKGFENVKIILPKPNSKPIKSPAPTE